MGFLFATELKYDNLVNGLKNQHMINLLQHPQLDESKYLSDIDLLFAAPSIFASGHSYYRDEKHYAMFNTANVIAKLRNEGYYPVTARSKRFQQGLQCRYS